jgi:hypothetical protein
MPVPGLVPTDGVSEQRMVDLGSHFIRRPEAREKGRRGGVKRIENVLEKINGRSEDPTVGELLDYMNINGIPWDARLYYNHCGSHDFVLEWDE